MHTLMDIDALPARGRPKGPPLTQETKAFDEALKLGKALCFSAINPRDFMRIQGKLYPYAKRRGFALKTRQIGAGQWAFWGVPR